MSSSSSAAMGPRAEVVHPPETAALAARGQRAPPPLALPLNEPAQQLVLLRRPRPRFSACTAAAVPRPPCGTSPRPNLPHRLFHGLFRRKFGS
jgi:hypothetical protein